MIELLEKLSPAEIHLLQEGPEVTIQGAMRVTFLDLLYRGVLAIKFVRKQANKNDKVRIHPYIIKGPNFKGYKPRQHEFAFLRLFSETKDYGITKRGFIANMYDTVGTFGEFVWGDIGGSIYMKGALKRGVPFSLTKAIRLSKNGESMRKKVMSEKREFIEMLRTYIEDSSVELLELLLSVRGNIIMMEQLGKEDFNTIVSLVKTIDEHLYEKYINVDFLNNLNQEVREFNIYYKAKDEDESMDPVPILLDFSFDMDI